MFSRDAKSSERSAWSAKTRSVRKESAPRPNERTSEVTTHCVTLITDGRETQLEVGADQYLLDAAVAAGLDLPYMCLQGWCTTCAGKLLQGTVDQSEARRIYVQDEQASFVLLCSAFARSDLRILTHQKEQMRAHRKSLGLAAPRG
jgi:ferredoxin